MTGDAEFDELFLKNYQEALLDAKRGCAPAQMRVAFHYVKQRDYQTAVEWYRKGANQGYAPAQSALGSAYEHGRGIPQNYLEAAKWYQRAAEQNTGDAQKSLGELYAKGQGVPQDYVEAAKWLIIAKANNSVAFSPGYSLEAIEQRMTRSQVTQAQALAQQWWNTHHHK